MTDGPRVLVFSSCAAVLAGIEATLGGGHSGPGTPWLLATACRYPGLVARARETEPDVLVLHDVDHDQVQVLGGRGRAAVVLALGDDCAGADLLHAVRAGISGAVSIDTDLPALRLACAEAMAGRPYLSPPLLAALLAHLSGRDGAEPAEPLGLTPREAQVLRHLAGGRSQSDISAVMRISNRTVKHHLGNVYRKLGVHSQTEAIVRAYQHRLVV